jgi:hypothetical protein
MMSRIYSWHRKISTGRHFLNGRHNTAQIQHCPISTTFYISIQDIIIYLHDMKFRWNRTMLNLCGIVAAILKMATSRNFSMSGINSGHYNLPTYEMVLKSAILKMATFYTKYTGNFFLSILLLNRYFIAIIYMRLWMFKRHFSTIFQFSKWPPQ